jgi:quercetin dioxygenase-like cupin family protein
LPVCRHLATALDPARCQPGPVGAPADAFTVIEPRLDWKVRTGAETHGEQFLDGHANATIAGPEGFEIRRDIRIGVSVMAPNVRYPDHHHPAEEIYVVLSDGQWRQADRPWHEPGIGGLVYNFPNVVHAMRSAGNPLLAIWFLWTGG